MRRKKPKPFHLSSIQVSNTMLALLRLVMKDSQGSQAKKMSMKAEILMTEVTVAEEAEVEEVPEEAEETEVIEETEVASEEDMKVSQEEEAVEEASSNTMRVLSPHYEQCNQQHPQSREQLQEKEQLLLLCSQHSLPKLK